MRMWADWTSSRRISGSPSLEILPRRSTSSGVRARVISIPNPDLFLSSAVRPAVAGFSKALAREVAPQGVTVNLICPGYVATERLRELAERRAKEGGVTVEEAWKAMEASIPMGRIGSVEEQADAAAFLCSDRAGYITGISLRVDGGKVNFLL